MSRLDKLHQLLDADPQDIEVHYMLAMEYKGTGDLDQALAKFDDCLQLDPHYAPAYFQKGSVHLTAGRIAEAKNTLSEGIAAARKAGDQHAAQEMQGLLDGLE